MKKYLATRHLLLVVIIVNSLFTFASDWLDVKYLGFFNFLEYLHEGLCVFGLWLIFLYLKSFKIFKEKDVRHNLKILLINLTLTYAIVALLKWIFDPVFIVSDFPPQTDDFNTIIFANLVGLLAGFSMVAFVLALRNLIFYKYKKRTRLYFYLALTFLSLTALATVIFKLPLDLTLSGESLYNNLPFSLTLIFLFMLSLRNSWITYLTRKEKFYYLIISIFMLWAVSYLFDYAYELPVPYHSLSLAVFVNATWFFLFFYVITTTLYLLLQLPTARIFERKLREVNSLQDLSRALSVEFDSKKLARLITDLIIDVTGSHYTWIELYDQENDELHVIAAKNLPLPEVGRLEHGAAQRLSWQIKEEKKPRVFNELTREQKSTLLSGLKSNVESLVGVPIFGVNQQFFGILYAAKSNTFGFDPDDVNLLEAFANQVAIALENADLLKKSFERERLEKELQIAREVQLRLLPQTRPDLGGYQLETLTITAYEVGGDYYDFVETQTEETLGLVIGDVSGKGTSAAFYMAEVKGVIQSIAQQLQSPRQILCHTNRVLSASLEKKLFITLTFAQLNKQNHQLTFARAGHCPLLHYQSAKNEVTFYQPPGIAVGLDRGTIFDRILEEQTLQLNRGDILCFYTDGLSEAMNKNGEEYSEERLSALIKKHAALPVEKIKEKLIDDIFQFIGDYHLHDDLTLIILKRTD